VRYSRSKSPRARFDYPLHRRLHSTSPWRRWPKTLWRPSWKCIRNPGGLNKVFLKFNLKMAVSGSIAEHLNEFNTLTSQLESIEINFSNEIRALVLLSSLPEACDGLMTVVSNSCGTWTLKFDDAVGVVLSEEVRRKSSGATKTSGSALSVERKGWQMNRKNKKNGKSKSKSGRGNSKSRSIECWQCGEEEHFQKDCKQKKDEKGKKQRKGLRICHWQW